MSGELPRLAQQVRRLKASMVPLDATLRPMDPDRGPNEIPSTRPYVRTKLFGAGKLNRMRLMMGSGVMVVDAVLPLRSWPEPVFRDLEPAFFGWFSGRIAPLNVVVLNVVVPCRPLT